MNEQRQSDQHSERETGNKYRYSHPHPLRQHLRPESLSAVAAPRDQYRLCKLRKAAGRLERRARKSCFQLCEEAKIPSSASRQYYRKNDGHRRKKQELSTSACLGLRSGTPQSAPRRCAYREIKLASTEKAFVVTG